MDSNRRQRVADKASEAETAIATTLQSLGREYKVNVSHNAQNLTKVVLRAKIEKIRNRGEGQSG